MLIELELIKLKFDGLYYFKKNTFSVNVTQKGSRGNK